jgi:hypothetical protein
MKTISRTGERKILDRLLDSLTDCFTPTVARRIVKIRADPETQARIDELAEKCNEGELSATERREYQSYVRAINLIAVFQSKARLYLSKARKSE